MAGTQWPKLLDMSKDDARRHLRALELSAYSSLVAALRAQGDLTSQKKSLLQQIQSVLGISSERHRAEIRRCVNDERLSTVAMHSVGSAHNCEWLVEGRRIAPFIPRLIPQTSFTLMANQAAASQSERNALLPSPAQTGSKEHLLMPSTIPLTQAPVPPTMIPPVTMPASLTPVTKANRPPSPATNVVVLPSGTSIHIKGGLNLDEEEDITGAKRRRIASSTEYVASKPLANRQNQMRITLNKPTLSATPAQKVILVSSAAQSATTAVTQKSSVVPVVRSVTPVTSHTKTSVVYPASSSHSHTDLSVPGPSLHTQQGMTLPRPRPKAVLTTSPRGKVTGISVSRPGMVIPVTSSAGVFNRSVAGKPGIHIKQEGAMKIITSSGSKILPKPSSANPPIVVVTSSNQSSVTSSGQATPVTSVATVQIPPGKVISISTGGKILGTPTKVQTSIKTVNPKALQLSKPTPTSTAQTISSTSTITTTSRGGNVVIVQQSSPAQTKPKPSVNTMEREFVSFIQKQTPKMSLDAQKKGTQDIPSQALNTAARSPRPSILAGLMHADKSTGIIQSDVAADSPPAKTVTVYSSDKRAGQAASVSWCTLPSQAVSASIYTTVTSSILSSNSPSTSVADTRIPPPKIDIFSSALAEAQINLDPYEFIDEDEPPSTTPVQLSWSESQPCWQGLAQSEGMQTETPASNPAAQNPIQSNVQEDSFSDSANPSRRVITSPPKSNSLLHNTQLPDDQEIDTEIKPVQDIVDADELHADQADVNVDNPNSNVPLAGQGCSADNLVYRDDLSSFAPELTASNSESDMKLSPIDTRVLVLPSSIGEPTTPVKFELPAFPCNQDLSLFGSHSGEPTSQSEDQTANDDLNSLLESTFGSCGPCDEITQSAYINDVQQSLEGQMHGLVGEQLSAGDHPYNSSFPVHENVQAMLSGIQVHMTDNTLLPGAHDTVPVRPAESSHSLSESLPSAASDTCHPVPLADQQSVSDSSLSGPLLDQKSSISFSGISLCKTLIDQNSVPDINLSKTLIEQTPALDTSLSGPPIHHVAHLDTSLSEPPMHQCALSDTGLAGPSRNASCSADTGLSEPPLHPSALSDTSLAGPSIKASSPADTGLSESHPSALSDTSLAGPSINASSRTDTGLSEPPLHLSALSGTSCSEPPMHLSALSDSSVSGPSIHQTTILDNGLFRLPIDRSSLIDSGPSAPPIHHRAHSEANLSGPPIHQNAFSNPSLSGPLVHQSALSDSGLTALPFANKGTLLDSRLSEATTHEAAVLQSDNAPSLPAVALDESKTASDAGVVSICLLGDQSNQLNLTQRSFFESLNVHLPANSTQANRQSTEFVGSLVDQCTGSSVIECESTFARFPSDIKSGSLDLCPAENHPEGASKIAAVSQHPILANCVVSAIEPESGDIVSLLSDFTTEARSVIQPHLFEDHHLVPSKVKIQSSEVLTDSLLILPVVSANSFLVDSATSEVAVDINQMTDVTSQLPNVTSQVTDGTSQVTDVISHATDVTNLLTNVAHQVMGDCSHQRDTSCADVLLLKQPNPPEAGSLFLESPLLLKPNSYLTNCDRLPSQNRDSLPPSIIGNGHWSESSHNLYENNIDHSLVTQNPVDRSLHANGPVNLRSGTDSFEEPSDESQDVTSDISMDNSIHSDAVSYSETSKYHAGNRKKRRKSGQLLNWKKAALGLLKRVMVFRGANRSKGEHGAAAWFLKPVTDEEAPGYSAIINQPMDFGTIKKRLECHYYHSLSEFHEDMTLIHSNCCTYNPPEHNVRRDCEQVFCFYRQEYEKLLHRLEQAQSETKRPRLDSFSPTSS